MHLCVYVCNRGVNCTLIGLGVGFEITGVDVFIWFMSKKCFLFVVSQYTGIDINRDT